MAYAVKLAADVRLERDRMLFMCCRRILHWTAAPDIASRTKACAPASRRTCTSSRASLQEHQAVVAAAHLAGLAVEETVFEPMAAAYACVYPEDRARGVALLDIGCIRPIWWSTTATRCCSRPAFRFGRTI